MEFRLDKIALRGDRRRGAGDEQLFLPARPQKSVNIADDVQILFGEYADREYRHPDFFQVFPGRAFDPEGVPQRVLHHHEIHVGRQRPRIVTVGGVHIRHSDAGIEPIQREVALDTAGIADEAVRIVQSVIGRDAGEMRRVLHGHVPLRDAVVGLANAADLSIRPTLRCDPFDDFVEIALLVRAPQAEFAAGDPRPANIRVHVGVTLLLDIPLDRSSLAPQKQRRTGQ